MGQRDVETLKQARESFVRKRRLMAEQMVPDGAAAQHFAPAFADLQSAIEAIDRAIQDEENLPEDYAEAVLQAPEQPRDGDGGGSDSGAVISVDFDPA